MKITFWGTRGSLPKADGHAQVVDLICRQISIAKSRGLTTLDQLAEQIGLQGQLPISFGGHTSCIEVSHGETSVYVDMGSGLKDAGTLAVKEGKKSFLIFQTHMHWDHIMGLPFFVPLYTQGHNVKIFHVHKNAPEYIRILFNGVNFPVKWEQLAARVEFVNLKLYKPHHEGELEVTPFCLDHPGGSFGYHFSAGGRRLAIGVDGEYQRRTREQLGQDLSYYQDLDMLVFDAQYEIDELAARFDWGHSSPNIGVELALRERIRHLVLTHHDPWSEPPKLERMLNEAQRYLRKTLPKYQAEWQENPDGPLLSMAYDGKNVELGR